MTKNHTKVSLLAKSTLLVAVLASLAACTSVPYRCTLEGTNEPENPTACAGMHESLAAAKQGVGGKQSVHLDDQGRIIPPEVRGNQAIQVLTAEAYTEPSGTPQYKQPKVFQVWTPGYIDKAGNLHDGRTSYFATQGQWRYGSIDGVGTRGHAVGAGLFKPAVVGELPEGRVVAADELKAAKKVVTGDKKAPATPAQQTKGAASAPADKVVLQNLSDSAKRVAAGTSEDKVMNVQAAPGVTAPNVKFDD